MAKRKAVITKRRLAIIFAAGVVVGAAGYVALDWIAESRAEAALAKVRARLPDDARLAYSGLEASFIGQSATLDTVIVQQPGRELRANTLTVAEVGETSGGNLRAGRVTANGVTAQTDSGIRLNAGTVKLADLVVAPGGRALRSLGEARADTLSLSHGDASARIADLDLRGVSPRRIGRIDAGIVEMRGMTEDAKDREVLRGVRVDGLDFSAIPPMARTRGADPAAMAAMLRHIAYDALRIRRAAVHRGGQRHLMLRGLESRRAETESPTRAWASGVDEVAVRMDSPRMKATGVLDDDNMLRGNVSGRQVFDPQAGTLTLSDMVVEVMRAGRLSGEIRFTGVPAGGQDGGVMPDRASLAKAKLAKVDITYTDKGILDSALSALATRTGQSRDALIERRLGALREVAADGPAAVRKSVDALAAFVRDGGAIRLRMDPPRDVAMSAALMQLTFQPVQTAQALNLRLSRP
jgi:hypothetical protein